MKSKITELANVESCVGWFLFHWSCLVLHLDVGNEGHCTTHMVEEGKGVDRFSCAHCKGTTSILRGLLS